MHHCFTKPNFQSREALSHAIAQGEPITVFSPGKAKPTNDGVVLVLGPRFPRVAQYYATLQVADGKVVGFAEPGAQASPGEYDEEEDEE
jgi:hypothetical protein